MDPSVTDNTAPPLPYHGKILTGDFSPALQAQVKEMLGCLEPLDRSPVPAMGYLSAWQEQENAMWYEFSGRRLAALLDCVPEDAAEVFRSAVLERRVYDYQGKTRAHVASRSLKHTELKGSRKGLRRQGEKRGLVEAVYKLALPDGRIVWLKDQARVTAFPDDGIHLSSGCLTDVTKEMEAEEELKKTQERLREKARALKAAQKIQEENTARLSSAVEQIELARKEAEKANRAKSEFLAVISHEIRNPMNGIIGTCDLVMNEALSAQQEEYLEIIRGSAISLMTLINDILDFSKIEAGKLEFQQTEFDIRDLFEEVAGIFLELVAKKGLELVLDIHPDVPARLISDPMRLRQVLINLISNALKFTDEGEIVLGVKTRRYRDSRVELLFQVSDTGIGIPPEHHDTLFDSFTQVDGANDGNFGGTGLGLAICRQIVEMMSGSIWVESRPGSGSQFFFKADFEMIASDRDAPDIPEQFCTSSALVAVPSLSLSRVLQQALGCWGFSVKTGTRLEHLPALLGKKKESGGFELILMDMGLEGLNQYPGSGAALEKNLPADTALIALCAPGCSSHPALAETLGASAILTKPIKHRQLLIAVKTGLGFPVDTDSDAPVPAGSVPQLTGTRVLLVEDSATNRRIGAEMLRMAGVTADPADNGLQAVEMCRKNTYHAVLMDIQMPHLDGIEAARIIRRDHPVDRLPIIAMSAHARSRKWKACLDAGINDYLLKPFSRNALMRVLKKQLDLTPGAPLPPTDTEPSPDRAVELPDLPGLDLDDALQRLGGDIGILSDILNDFCTTNTSFHRTLKSHLAASDFKAAGTLAHSVKGGAGNLGAANLFTAAKKLEQACWGQAPDEASQHLEAAQSALEELTASAQILADHIGQADTDNTLKSGETGTPDKDPSQLLVSLKSAVDTFDPVESQALVEELINRMPPEMETQLSELEEHISQYRFDDALGIIQTLLQKTQPER